MPVNNKLKIMWKEVVVAYFEAKAQKLNSGQSMKFEVGTFHIKLRSPNI